MDTETTNVSFRPMQADDIPAVRAIDQMSFSLPWPERAYDYEIHKNQSSLLWVAEIDPPGEGSKVVGMVVIWQILDEAHIATLAVHPDFRRQGIGENLLLNALDGALDRGAKHAMLEVRANNWAARKLYKGFGFEIVGRRPRYYRDNNEDALLMNLDVLDEAYIQRMRAKLMNAKA